MGLEFSEQVQRLRMVDLVGRPEAMALARPVADRIIHLTNPFVAGRVEVGALGEVLADQAVGVLVGAALPGMVRQREVEDRAGRLLDPREVGELLADAVATAGNLTQATPGGGAGFEHLVDGGERFFPDRGGDVFLIKLVSYFYPSPFIES